MTEVHEDEGRSYLFTIPSSKLTGASSPTLSLACSLKGTGRRVVLLCKGGSLARKAKEAGLEVYDLSLLSLLRHGREAWVIIVSRSQDHWWSALMWGLVKPVYRLWYKSDPPRGRPWERVLFAFTAGVFAPYPIEGAHWLPGEVDTSLFHPGGARPPFSVVMVSRMKPGRGQERLLEAVSRLPMHVSVTFKGGGKALGRVKALAQTLGVHKDCDWVPYRLDDGDYPALLRRHHALIYLSVGSEATARTVLEAMASGLVVLAVPQGGVPYLLGDWNLPLDTGLEDTLCRYGSSPALRRWTGLLNARRGRLFSPGARLRRFLRVVEHA